jgi:AcrR family transcriptional regulator
MPKAVRHKPDTKAKIIEAAKSLFAEKGFDAASIRDIALRAGVNKSLVHYYFISKLDILNQVAKAYMKRVLDVQDDFIRNIGEGDLSPDTLKMHLTNTIRLLFEEKDFLNIVVLEGLKSNTERYFIFELIDILMDTITQSINGKVSDNADFTAFFLDHFFFTITPLIIYIVLGEKLAEHKGLALNDMTSKFVDIITQKVIGVADIYKNHH